MGMLLPQIAPHSGHSTIAEDRMLFRAYGVRSTGAAALACWLRGLFAVLGLALAGCSSSFSPELGPMFGSPVSPAPLSESQPQNSLGAAGGVRVGLILSLSADGNAGAAAQSMRNAAELALAEFANPNIQLIVKDDAGTAQGAQAAVMAALGEGAEIILGPLLSH